jgi:hypothetical protein
LPENISVFALCTSLNFIHGSSQGKPQINEVSKALVAGKDRQGPIYERLLSEGEEMRRQKERLAEEHARHEVESVLGVPQIDKMSAEIVKNKRHEQATKVDQLVVVLQAMRERK